MPEMDGLELTRRMRQLDEAGNRCAQVILLTAKEGVRAAGNFIAEPSGRVGEHWSRPGMRRSKWVLGHGYGV